jgi:hypothetical protein
MCKSLLRMLVLAALAFGVITSERGYAQDASKIWKVGILWHAANLEEEMVMFGPFAEGMRELGYVEGRNVVFDHTTSMKTTTGLKRAPRNWSTVRWTLFWHQFRQPRLPLAG